MRVDDILNNFLQENCFDCHAVYDIEADSYYSSGHAGYTPSARRTPGRRRRDRAPPGGSCRQRQDSCA